MAGLRTRDYERILDLVVALTESPNLQRAWQVLVVDLVESLHGTMSVVAHLQWQARRGHMVTGVPAWLGQARMDGLISTYMHHHPVMKLYASGIRAPLTLDQVADETWHRSEAYHVGREAIGVTRQLALPLIAPTGTIRTVVIGRAGGDFNDRDREYARRLQPLLVAFDAHFRELERLERTAPAAKRGDVTNYAAKLAITPRELAVLVLLAEGLTAAAIARRLGISPSTVNKHQEKLYRKLATRDRLTTVLAAQDLGLLPSHGSLN